MKHGPLLVLVSRIRYSTAYIYFLVTHHRIPSNEYVRRLSHPLQLCHLSCPRQDLPLTVVVFLGHGRFVHRPSRVAVSTVAQHTQLGLPSNVI